MPSGKFRDDLTDGRLHCCPRGNLVVSSWTTWCAETNVRLERQPPRAPYSNGCQC